MMEDLFPTINCSVLPSQQTFDEFFVLILDKFVQSLVSEPVWHHSQDQINVLNWALSALKSNSLTLNGSPQVKWFGDYGCALLITIPRVGTAHLNLVCLDGWEFLIHGGPSRNHFALCGANVNKTLHVGTVALADFEKFWKNFIELLSAEKRTCENRSAANNEQGHQKTPAMIHAVMKDALTEQEIGISLPRGGFTDVGLHTGGSKRYTAWSLVRAVLQILLESKNQSNLYRIFMAQFKLFCIEISEVEDLDTLMGMLEEAVIEGLTLTDPVLKYDIKIFEDRCTLIRSDVDRRFLVQGTALVRKFAITNLNEIEFSYRNIVVLVPSELSPNYVGNDFDLAKSLASTNIGLIPVYQKHSSISLWLDRLKLDKNSSAVTNLLVKCTIERFVFEMIMNIRQDANVDALTHQYIDKVVDQYRLAVSNILRNNPDNALLNTEIKSCQLLVLWIAACVVHHLALKDPIAILKEYSFALNINDLKYLVLSEKAAIDAALNVAAYIRQVNKAAICECIFSMRRQDETMDFAKRYAEKYEETKSIWKVESASAIAAMNRHWADVQRKKAELKRLDLQLDALNKKCDGMKKTLEDYIVPRSPQGRDVGTSVSNDNMYRNTEREISNLQSQIHEKKREISVAEIPPEPVLQSLPENVSSAWPVLFFLYMPKQYQTLSRLLFMAQQMLLPEAETETIFMIDNEVLKVNVAKIIKVAQPNTLWCDYYSRHKGICTPNPVQSTKVVLGSYSLSKDGCNWYPKNVRDYASANQGVWYPDSLQPGLFWSGGSNLDQRGGYFNPFASISNDVFVHTFTEKLPEDYQSMQWAMVQSGYDTCPSRSNWPEAVQDEMVGGKIEHMSFGGIRAFPNQQLRKLCVVLRERSLPLDKPAVHSLLRQTLFQLGDLSDDDIPQALWWRDCKEHRDGFATLSMELEALKEELQSMSRYHGAMLILGELAAFVSQWCSSGRDVARAFAKITRDWADEILIEIESVSIDKVAELRARRCVFSMYSLHCHCTGELSCEDVRDILDNICISENSCLFEETTSYDDRVRALTLVTRNDISRRLETILTTLDAHPEFLTSSCKLILEQTPQDLDWRRYKSDSQCYEATSSAGDLFSMNAQTGVVLFNGLPPRRLPFSVISNGKYKRTFGDHNFDVVTTIDNIMRTTRSVKGFYYEFFEDVNKGLIVREIDSEGSNVLELLDGTEDGIETWGIDLPLRLQVMHSHWISRQRSIIVLRSVSFDQRDVSFLCRQDRSVDDHFSCYRVPENLSAKTWLELCDEPLLSTFDKLVLESNPATCPIIKILQKFELDSRLIHVYSTGEDSTTFELPRFGLSFTLNIKNGNYGSLESNDYRGFVLSKSQLFEDDLRGFTQYLILESLKGVVMVLIPAGTIVRVKSSTVVKGSDSCDAERKHHCYKRHDRFGKLEVGEGPLAVEGRLQLAAIYASIDSKVPYRHSRQTGGELAIDLIRQSWVNRPLQENEYGHLRSICTNSRHSCSLVLLCYELDQSTKELEFLFPEKSKCLPLEFECDTSTQYSQRKRAGNLNSRQFLTADEETSVFGLSVQSMELNVHEFIPDLAYTIEGSRQNITGFENAIQKMIQQRGVQEPAPFPLESSYFTDSEIGRATLSELRLSWNKYQTLQLSTGVDEVDFYDISTFEAILKKVKLLRENLERDLLQIINMIPDRTSSGFAMRRAANFIPVAVIGDLAKFLLSPADIRIFNPFLSNEVQNRILGDISVLLQYCVFEDKIKRMNTFAIEKNSQELVREMNELGRGWDVQDHPEWLVFEFEQGLQIRCIQSIVAQHLMKNPGAIAQLNMGEGKTRVILPMLILSMAKKDSLVRLHFLSPLLGEVYEYLHRHLTASVFLRKLFLVPFRRDVNLSEDDARRLYATLRRCMDSCGAICVAPEHRLSLELKFYELLAANKHTLCALLEKNQELPYVDIIDESDVILGHKLQLIYAVGSCMPLPDGNDRGVACEAVLWQFQSNAAVAEIVKISGLCRRVSKRGAGTFDDIRLIPGAALDLHRSALIEQIVNGIIDNPPYHMRWLRHIPFSREAVVKFVTDPSETWLTPVENESGVIWSQILALRGLLAHGIFENCLKARYRVDYGIDQRRGVKHRTAVPYRASDSPSERAEFKHPEMLLLRTILSYYHEGISRNEMKESVTSLLSHQSISQRLEYDLWFASARQTMSREQVKKLENVAQLDVTNELQLDLLHEVYGYNMAAINFWLNNCVFPSETIQFPQSLIANAFHIANNSQGRVIGFSGTKDNHLLLPHQVEQSMRVHPELTATDGKMLDLLGPKNDQTVEVIDDSIDMSSGVLELAGRGYNSLIDAGGTMAGLSNRVVAMQMLDLLSLHGSALKGVVYFDV
eukprot:gene21325-27629_t